MLNLLWKMGTVLTDWRTIVRKLNQRPAIDVVFITNIRDQAERKRFISNKIPARGYIDGPRFNFDDIMGRICGINVLTEDLATSSGRKKAKKYIIEAVKWARKRGAKIVLFAATTKRLFGRDGASLKEMFPELIFTIGDNGTCYILIHEVLNMLRNTGIPANSNKKIAVLGAYGILGEQVTKSLIRNNYNVVGAGANLVALKRLAAKYNIEICENFSDMGKIDAVIACTHSSKIKLNCENINLIKRNNKKLLVVDVAEPSNLDRSEYFKCIDRVLRIDGGNAYSPDLKYILSPVIRRMMGLSKGVTFGCFAEALSLAWAYKRGEDINSRNWFTINEDNIDYIATLFQGAGFTIPTPKCYGRKLKSISLMSSLPENETK